MRLPIAAIARIRTALVGWGAVLAWSAGALVASAWVPAASAADCPNPAKALGVSRVIEIDTATGAMFGTVTKRATEESFLAPGEVVLTFDDGPVPRVTKPILDALDAYCTKATFFPVGKMALSYPSVMKDVLARGHTVGGHTFTHPNNLRRLSLDRAMDEIERGFAAVALAGGADIAPFFRFPGLNDSDEMLEALQQRGIASFTVDVISNDSYIGNPQAIADRTLRHTVARGGGILLFHDLKRPTARAIPAILAGLKARGFKVVHLVAKSPMVPLGTFDDELAERMAKTRPAAADTPPSPGLRTADGLSPPTTYLAPGARSRITESAPAGTDLHAASAR